MPRTAVVKLIRWGSLPPTVGDCTTCMGMSLSYVMTGIMTTTKVPLMMAAPRRLLQARIVSNAAAAGTAMPVTAVLRTATSVAPPTGPAIWASALRGQWIDFLTLCSFTLFLFSGGFPLRAADASAQRDANPSRVQSGNSRGL
jgi:hypothetical protein